MKGMIFRAFFDHVEARHGADMVDDVIDAAQLPHGGVYTSAGTYPFVEMVALVTAFTKMMNEPFSKILEDFGKDCFYSLMSHAPQFFSDDRSLFDVLENIDTFHETEARKLYPDAELPSFLTQVRAETQLVLAYHSCKPLSDLAVGVIKGADDHLRENVKVSCEAIQGDHGSHVRIQVDRIG